MKDTVEIVAYSDNELPRKRACINCGHRHMNDPDYCHYDWHYIGYLNVWDGWCRHWCKSKEECYVEDSKKNGRRKK